MNRSLQSSVSLSDEDVGLIHKKIRISSALLAWEHERFALAKQSSATLSYHQSHSENIRHSIFDDRYIHVHCVIVICRHFVKQ